MRLMVANPLPSSLLFCVVAGTYTLSFDTTTSMITSLCVMPTLLNRMMGGFASLAPFKKSGPRPPRFETLVVAATKFMSTNRLVHGGIGGGGDGEGGGGEGDGGGGLGDGGGGDGDGGSGGGGLGGGGEGEGGGGEGEGGGGLGGVDGGGEGGVEGGVIPTYL